MNTLSFLKRHSSIVLIIASVLVVTVVSQVFYVHASIRLDESQSIWQTSRTLRGTIATVARDVHVPAYHVILHYWQILFGSSIETARSLSLAFFLVSIPAFYALARLVVDKTWSRFAVLAYAFSPFMLWYANEARMYTMLVLVAILSQYFFIRIMQHKSGWIGYSLVAMLGIYVHYFFVFNLLAQAVFFLVNRKSFAKGTFMKLGALAILLIAELSPWLYFFHKLGSASGESPLLTKPSTVDFFNAFSQFAFGFQVDAVNTVLLSLWPILMAAALLFIRTKIHITKPIAYLLTAGLLPIVLAFAISITVRPFFISRYMISCLPALIIVLAWLLRSYPKHLRRILASVAVSVIVVTSVLQIINPLTPVKEDFRGASSYINTHATTHDVVILSTPFTLYPFEYNYGFGAAQVRTLPEWDGRATTGIPAFNAGQLGSQVHALSDGHQNAYILLSYDQGYESNIKDYFQSHYPLISQHEYSRDLTLYVYQLNPTSAPKLSALPYNLKIPVPVTSQNQ